MQHGFRRALTVVAMAFTVLAMTVTGAFAQYPTAQDFSVSCVFPGGAGVTCSVVGAQTGEIVEVRVLADGTVVFEGSLTADDAGEAVFEFTLPDGAGELDVEVTGNASGEVVAESFDLVDTGDGDDDGQPVTTPDEGDALPFTGTEAMTYAAVGVVLLGAGLTVLRARRREHAGR